MRPAQSRPNSSFVMHERRSAWSKRLAVLTAMILTAGCATQTSVSESCPLWASDNTFYPSEEVISAMDRQEKEQVAEINREVETFCTQ